MCYQHIHGKIAELTLKTNPNTHLRINPNKRKYEFNSFLSRKAFDLPVQKNPVNYEAHHHHHDYVNHAC